MHAVIVSVKMPVRYNIVDNDDAEGPDRLMYFTRHDAKHPTTARALKHGYILYRLDIPRERYTESIMPRTKHRIFSVSERNRRQFWRLRRYFPSERAFIEELQRRNFGGYDATAINRRGCCWITDGITWERVL